LDDLQTENGFGSTEFHILRANENSMPRFIFYHTQSKKFRKQLELEMSGSAGQKRVPKKSVSNYAIALPPTKAEQTRIATILTEMDAEIEALERRLEKVRLVKQGMMQSLLTGKVRLV
jgi:type I restriction enzyme S subunit